MVGQLIKMKKPITKKLFFLHIPIYEREICIIVGMTHDEAVKEAKKQKCTKKFIEDLEWETAKELCDKVADKIASTQGAVVRVNDESYFVFLKPYKNDWEYFDTLSHELFHLVQFMGDILKFWDDVEPPAYLHTWLFKELRRVLSGNKK